MGLLRKIVRSATKPLRAKMHGAAGERKVESKLNPLIFGKVEHRQINNLILVDDNGKIRDTEHQSLGWKKPDTMETLDWAEADQPIVDTYLDSLPKRLTKPLFLKTRSG